MPTSTPATPSLLKIKKALETGSSQALATRLASSPGLFTQKELDRALDMAACSGPASR